MRDFQAYSNAWLPLDFAMSKEAGELHVRQRANKHGTIGAPKSASSRRTVPIDPAVLMPALKAWKIACPVGDLVFPAPRSDQACNLRILVKGSTLLRARRILERRSSLSA
jgi:integrase